VHLVDVATTLGPGARTTLHIRVGTPTTAWHIGCAR
jgi:hypothetical protein